jgi:hypothetical protein
MKLILPILFGIIIVFTACSDDDRDTSLTYEKFEEHLKAEMTYQQIVWRFGNPVADIGSGIHIYVYSLDDGTQIKIGYTDQIVYARHTSSSGQVLHELI